MIEVKISEKEQGMKAEKFVRKFLSEAPLGFIYRAFRKKDIKANGHWIHKDYVCQLGDTIRIYVTDQQLEDFKHPRSAEKKPFPYAIFYEDENVLIVEKPAGILVYGDNNDKRNTLTQKVLDYLYYEGFFDPARGGFTPAPAHRLDRNTSGLVVYGKSDAGLKALEELFKEREEISKTYEALVKGEIRKDGQVDAPLKKFPEEGRVKIVPLDEGGKTALTKYHPIEKFSGITLVECLLVTGRTHQIRVHMASIDHPIIGDGKYGDFAFNHQIEERYGYQGQFLHASEISFGKLTGVLASLSGKKFVAPMPKEEETLLAQLRAEK